MTGPLFRSRPGRIYAIADAALLGTERLPQAVGVMAREGVPWIQVRVKPGAPPAPEPATRTGDEWAALSDADLLGLVERCHAAASAGGSVLWLDDRVDLAGLVPVGGVHLGQADLPPAAAGGFLRRARPQERVWIGQSTHCERQLEAADADPEVDVIAVGPVFPTTGKWQPEPVVGLDFVRWARDHTSKPLVAIGGIGAANVGSVLAAGADRAAVLGAVCRGDLAENCRRLLDAAG